MSDPDFRKILADADIPTTQAELETAWKDEVEAQESPISNDNNYSPFWRLMTACITEPVLWLVDFMVVTVFPNSYVKTATGHFLDLLAWAVNLTRKPETYAQGVITFTREDVNSPYTVPAETVIQSPAINGVVYELIVDVDTPFEAGEATLDVPCTAAQPGTAYNLATGYYAILKEQIAGISSVTNGDNWLTAPGTEEETSDELRDRIRNQFGTASDFHTDAVYRSLISEFPGVKTDAIWFEHDAPRGPGTANAFVLFDFDAPVANYLADINKYITDDGHHGHGDDLQVYQMPEQGQVLTADVWHDDFLTAEEITQLQSDIDDFIRCSFRENQAYSATFTFPYARFSFSRLGRELHREFPTIHSVDFDLTDVVSGLWVPVLTSLTINMAVTE